MSWWIGALAYRRREDRLRRRPEALADLAAPPVEHPVLGLGGRSLELSAGEGVPVSPDAFVLAVLELRSAVERGDGAPDGLRDAADYLHRIADGLDGEDDAKRMLGEIAAALPAPDA